MTLDRQVWNIVVKVAGKAERGFCADTIRRNHGVTDTARTISTRHIITALIMKAAVFGSIKHQHVTLFKTPTDLTLAAQALSVLKKQRDGFAVTSSAVTRKIAHKTFSLQVRNEHDANAGDPGIP